jgi:hypothetical protein
MALAHQDGRLWKIAGAALVGVFLGVAITVARLVYLAPSAEEQLAALLDQNPLFQMAIKHDPSRRGVYLDRLKTAYQQRGNEAAAAEAHVIGREIGVTHHTALLSMASDAALSHVLAVTSEYLAYAYEHDPDGCYAYARGVSQSTQLPPAMSERMADAMFAVIDTATRSPVSMTIDQWRAGSAKGEEIRKQVARSEEAKSMYLGESTGRPATTAADRKGACLFMTRVYQQIERVDAPLRFQTLRAMFAAPRRQPKPPVSFQDQV